MNLINWCRRMERASTVRVLQRTLDASPNLQRLSKCGWEHATEYRRFENPNVQWNSARENFVNQVSSSKVKKLKIAIRGNQFFITDGTKGINCEIGPIVHVVTEQLPITEPLAKCYYNINSDSVKGRSSQFTDKYDCNKLAKVPPIFANSNSSLSILHVCSYFVSDYRGY